MPSAGQCRSQDNYQQQKVSAVFRFKDINIEKLFLKMQDNLLTISGSRERVQFNEGGCTTRQDEKVVLMSVVDVDFNVYDFYEV